LDRVPPSGAAQADQIQRAVVGNPAEPGPQGGSAVKRRQRFPRLEIRVHHHVLRGVRTRQAAGHRKDFAPQRLEQLGEGFHIALPRHLQQLPLVALSGLIHTDDPAPRFIHPPGVIPAPRKYRTLTPAASQLLVP